MPGQQRRVSAASCRSPSGATASRFAGASRRRRQRRRIRSPARWKSTEYQGSYVKVTINVGGDVFVANVSDQAYFAEPVTTGDPVVASWNVADVHVLSTVDSGAAGDPYLDGGH